MVIESTQNPRIKHLIKLQEKARERKKQALFLVEGIQENELALSAGFQAVEFYVCSSIFKGRLDLSQFSQFELSPALFEKLAYRKTTGGIIGVYQTKNLSLEAIQLPADPLIVVLEAVEKPGNLGAVLRTCDGAGVDLLVICDPLVDFYNPNVIRSSVGTVFTNQWIAVENERLLPWLKEKNIQIISTYLSETTQSLYAMDFKKASAIVLGTEATGLSAFWKDHADALVKIPMHGKVDSLNVSNAAAICIYEAVRQKSE
ncbi:MAG TPA: RNA methyltransferase [Moheibacter sp.]|nr:RNA methyltransferase [Moheibacter sp.]